MDEMQVSLTFMILLRTLHVRSVAYPVVGAQDGPLASPDLRL